LKGKTPTYYFIFDCFLHRKALGIAMSICFVIFSILNAQAQLSPGKLTKAHSKLEGMANCTQCHTIGDKISEQKCLSCHKEINVRITAKKGFHVSAQVKGKECITCHSEHHGLNFDMIRFDKKTFNHNSTGYELKGGHKVVAMDCAKCHKPDNIASTTLKNKPDTYLGLDPKCLSCHDDYHQKTLTSNCTECHNETKFKPASSFNHEKTSFALRGAHKSVSCVDCHKMETKNAVKFQHFADTPHKNCSSCHTDVHKGSFGQNCKSCHNEESFKKISPSKSFQHSITGFELEGKHKTIDCKACHDGRNGTASNTFQEFNNINNIECLTCHKDIHESKFGTDCKKCHNQNSFKINNTNTLSDFDHQKTNFNLIGKHQNVDCRKCHTADLTAPLAHNQCISCHKDNHNGDFAGKTSLYPDCNACHSEQGFSPSSFTLDAHENADFKLTGAHIATPCISCHFTNQKWTFANIGKNCVDCHKDIHYDFIDKKYYSEASCKTCHNTETWSVATFDHSQTQFELKGKHQKITCSQCHFENVSGVKKQVFKGLSTNCSECHQNIHGKQFEVNGVTDCIKCHGFDGWGHDNFNHDNTQFRLEGAHLNVKCDQCHKETTIFEDKKVKVFKINKHQCTDCHS
jgi:hypothetical protein